MNNLSSENYAITINANEELKAKLLNICAQQDVKKIMLTSCNAGDGVSTIARNLALSLASGALAKVLLIELNPNVRSLHTTFEHTAEDKAFSLVDSYKLLTKQSDPFLESLNASSGIYTLVSSKPGFVCSSNLVQSEAFIGLLDFFTAQYDYVILDAPPVFGASGCLALSALADGVILVLRSEHTRREVAKNAINQLEGAGARLLGSIINMKKHYIPNFIYSRL